MGVGCRGRSHLRSDPLAGPEAWQAAAVAKCVRRPTSGRLRHWWLDQAKQRNRTLMAMQGGMRRGWYRWAGGVAAAATATMEAASNPRLHGLGERWTKFPTETRYKKWLRFQFAISTTSVRSQIRDINFLVTVRSHPMNSSDMKSHREG